MFWDRASAHPLEEPVKINQTDVQTVAEEYQSAVRELNVTGATAVLNNAHASRLKSVPAPYPYAAVWQPAETCLCLSDRMISGTRSRRHVVPVPDRDITDVHGSASEPETARATPSHGSPITYDSASF